MRYSLAVAALVGYTAAFPAVMEMLGRDAMPNGGKGGGGGSGASTKQCDFTGYKCPAQKVNAAAQAISKSRGNCGPRPCAPFVKADQLVSVSGEHVYKKPGKSDIRGPCPGLNAAANHGYLSRTGVTNQTETINGLFAAYGMGIDISEALAVLSIAQFGDPITGRWSIGGPVPNAALSLVNSGISYSHNNYESDGSQTRCDAALLNGDAHSLVVSRFAETYARRLVAGRGATPGTGFGYTLDSFSQDYLCKTDWSIAKNPLYVSAPLAGLIVAPAAYNFIINFMSNHSEANPNGWLSPEVYKSFFAMSGTYPNFQWNPGQERIPYNWYRRSPLSPYDNDALVGDLAIEFAAYPDTARLGCNQGKVNTYVQGDPSGVLGELGSVGLGGNFAQFLPPPANCPGIAYNPRGPAQNY